jgi:hypothetical protein
MAIMERRTYRPKSGAAKHGYTENQKNNIKEKLHWPNMSGNAQELHWVYSAP